MGKVKYILLGLIFFVFSVNPVKAALVTVDPQGQTIWQILGDESSLSVKSIAENVTPSPDTPISLKTSDGKVELNGMDVTNLKETLVEVQARGEVNNLKIGQTNGLFNIEENGIIANTAYPITIDPAKDKLTVSTSTGDRLLGILPYEAVQSLIRGKFIDAVKNNEISLNENSKGELGYEVKGTRKVNILNVLAVTADVTSTVSATNGEVIKIDEPQWLKIFGFLFV